VIDRDIAKAQADINTTMLGRADLDAACVSLVAGSTGEQVLDAFGADPSASGDDADEDSPGVSVIEVAGGIIAIEDNGFQGSLPAVMRSASAHGRAASTLWNDVGDSAITFAEGGEILDAGDYLLGEEQSAASRGLRARRRDRGAHRWRLEVVRAAGDRALHRRAHRGTARVAGRTRVPHPAPAGRPLVRCRARRRAARRLRRCRLCARRCAARVDPATAALADLADTVATLLRPGGAVITKPAELLLRRTLDRAGRGAPQGHVGAAGPAQGGEPGPARRGAGGVKYATRMLPDELHVRLYTESTRVLAG
jgi:hypothetical protein